MVEVKADTLEESFDALERDEDGIAALKAELDVLKAKIASGAIQPQRPALDGVKSTEANMFTEQYLRRGIEAGLETKAIGSSSDSIVGYAVPEEIDEQIDSTLAPAPTEVAIVELPDDGSGSDQSPVVAVAASNSGGGRTVPLRVELGNVDVETRTTSSRAKLGTAATALARGQSLAIDLLNSVDVQLMNPNAWLESSNDEALANGANLAMVGRELIQFGHALALEPGRFRLSRLLRGLRGTEWATPSHQPGERFVLLERSQLHRPLLSSRHCGSTMRVRPLGLADSPAQEVATIISGEAMRPPSPVHLRARIKPDGTLRCTWVRRSRHGWAWLDGVDTPLGCSIERYRITLHGSAGLIDLETSVSEAEFSAAEVASLQSDALEVSVVQIGDLAVSRPATFNISIN